MINKALEKFYKILFQKTSHSNNVKLKKFFNEVSVLCLSQKQQNKCKNEILKQELSYALKNRQ